MGQWSPHYPVFEWSFQLAGICRRVNGLHWDKLINKTLFYIPGEMQHLLGTCCHVLTVMLSTRQSCSVSSVTFGDVASLSPPGLWVLTKQEIPTVLWSLPCMRSSLPAPLRARTSLSDMEPLQV